MARVATRRVAKATALLLSTSCAQPGDANNEELVCEFGVPNVPTIHLSADEFQRGPPVSVTELWRAGGVDDDDVAQLTLPASARVGPDGLVAIPDFRAATTWLLSPDGAWLGPAGTRGQGPGEVQNPIGASWTEDGELLILDAGQFRVAQYNLESGVSDTRRIPADLLGPLYMGGEMGWFGLRSDGVAFVEFPATIAQDGSGRVPFYRGGPEHQARHLAWEASYPPAFVPDMGRYLPEWPRAILAVGGTRWAVAPMSDRYEILVFGSGDEPELHICVLQAEAFGQVERDDHDHWYPSSWVSELEMSETVALFSRIVLDYDGRFWVERSLPRPSDGNDRLYGVPGAVLDVLSPTGEAIQRVQMPADLRFLDAKGDTLWALAFAQFGLVEVVAATLSRSAPE